MATKTKMRIVDMKRVLGSKLIHVEHRTMEGHNASGGEEVLMEFDNGGEVLIYQSDDGIIWIEGD